MSANENTEQKMTCPICGIALLIKNKNGSHNFCPASLKGGKIMDICIACKMKKGKTDQIDEVVY